MKLVWVVIAVVITVRVSAQSQELEQLRLDLEKLAQFKLMLSEMKSGYQTLLNGYNSVRDGARANFSLHRNYLDGLLVVNPFLKASPAVQRISTRQSQIVADCQTLLTRLKLSGVFTGAELNELVALVNRILDIVSADRDLLVSVLTPGKFRMSDGERTAVIESVDRSTQKQAMKLNALSDEYNRLLAVRVQGKRDIESLKRLNKQ